MALEPVLDIMRGAGAHEGVLILHRLSFVPLLLRLTPPLIVAKELPLAVEMPERPGVGFGVFLAFVGTGKYDGVGGAPEPGILNSLIPDLL